MEVGSSCAISSNLLPQQDPYSPLEDNTMFKVLVDNKLKTFLKAIFARASLDMQTEVVSVAVCQTIAVWT